MENFKWKIRDLKKAAKTNLKRYYWWAVLVCIIVSVVTGGFGSSYSGINGMKNGFSAGYNSSSNTSSSTSSSVISEYQIAYSEGYEYGYKSEQSGSEINTDSIEEILRTQTSEEEYISGYIEGYKSGWFDAYSNAEYNATAPTTTTTEENYNPSVMIQEFEQEIDNANSAAEIKQACTNLYNKLDEYVTANTGLKLDLIIRIVVIFVIVIYIIALLFNFLVSFPVLVGQKRFFQMARVSEKSNIIDIAFAFKKGRYFKIVKAGFFQSLYIFLWSLLLVIPGIIKTFSYALVPFIMAENPSLGANRAITISKKTMKGEKFHYFLISVSFILWFLLCTLTCGVGSIFLAPYMEATYNEFYALMRAKAITEGFATTEELPGFYSNANDHIESKNAGFADENTFVTNDANAENTDFVSEPTEAPEMPEIFDEVVESTEEKVNLKKEDIPTVENPSDFGNTTDFPENTDNN